MKNVTRSVMLATAASLLVAPLAFGQVTATDAEFKCEAKATAASTKFVGAKSKCVIKCLAGFWKGDPLYPEADCLPPYGGLTLACITDPLKGAEAKFVATTRKNCDPAIKITLDCPECYNGGDCTQYADDYMANIEGQVDSFVPGVGCERAGADPAEQKCQTATAKALTKETAGVVKCYIKCETNAHKGLISASTCTPPATDPPTATCISGVENKAILAANKLCGDIPGAKPDCPNPDDYGGNDGASWVNLVDIAISGNIPGNFCE
jgi:hypothetical protein